MNGVVVSPDQTQTELLCVYKLVSMTPQPSFDASKTFRRWILPVSIDRKFRAFSRRHHLLISLSYFVGLLFRILGMLHPLTNVTYWLIIASLFLQSIGLFSVSLTLCCDVVRLLFGLFDLWMVLVSMVLWTVFLGISYGDIRVILLPYMLLDLQNAVMSDAYIQPNDMFRVSAVLALVFIVILYCEFALVSQSLNEVTIFRLSERFAVSSLDMVQNTTLTVGMLLSRVAFAKLLSKRRHHRNAVQTIVYRCKIKFELVTAAAMLLNTNNRLASSIASAQQQGRKTIHHLRYITPSETFDARKTLFPFAGRALDPMTKCQRLLLYTLGGIGFLLSIIPGSGILPSEFEASVSILGVSTTTLFVLKCATFYQQRLLRRIWRSFDFMFIMFQVVTAFTCVAYMFLWRWKTCTMLASNGLWILWVLQIDALLPVTRQRLGLRSWFSIPILLWNIVVCIMGVVSLAIGPESAAHDRIIFEASVFGHHVCMYTGSFLINRLILIVVWNFRLLYRVCTRTHGDECILLSGPVEYNSSLRGWSLAPKFAVVGPT